MRLHFFQRLGHIPWYAFRFDSSRSKAKSMGCAELVGKPSSLVNVTRRGALRFYDPPQEAWIFFKTAVQNLSKSDGADPTELLGGCSHGVIYYYLSMFVWFCRGTFFHIISERPPWNSHVLSMLGGSESTGCVPCPSALQPCLAAS